MKTGELIAVVVIPCLDEEHTIPATCESLGFGAGTESRHSLVLVDNGSSDGTLSVCRAIADAARGRVHVVSEHERGYVPARTAGISAAEALPHVRSADLAQVVVLQADADTIYSPGYVDAMVAAARPGRLLAATVATDVSFEDAHPALAELAAFDATVIPRPPARDLDVIVDDKACAFTLADYRRWGGHRREYRADGVEILAETSRLFLAGRMCGAGVVDVGDASAWHSHRRVEHDAAQHLASAGFPYGTVRVAGDAKVSLSEIDRLFASGDRTQLDSVLRVRRLHLLALFRILPALVGELVASDSSDADLESVLRALPRRVAAEVAEHPGALIEDVLNLIAAGERGPLGRLV